MNQQTIGIILICAGVLYGIFQLLRNMPNSTPPQIEKPVEPEPISGVVNDPDPFYFFSALLDQIGATKNPQVKQHLIDAGKAELDSLLSEPTPDGNSPT